MKDFIYVFRVFFISLEFACFLLFVIFSYFLDSEQTNKLLFLLNKEAVGWALIYPTVIAAWTLKQGGGFLFPPSCLAVILRKWPDYRLLKIHLNVGVFNSIFYAMISFLVWFFDFFYNSVGFWVFVASVVALSINALTFYLASIEIKSNLYNLDELNNK